MVVWIVGLETACRHVPRNVFLVALDCQLLMLNLCVGEGRGSMSEEDDDDFYDAISEQTEEIKIALPSSDKKAHQ